MLEYIGLPDIGVGSLEKMFFSCTRRNFDRAVVMHPRHFPELINHVMILLPMRKRIYLLRPWSGAKRTFRFMVNDGIADPELQHLDLLPA